MIALRTWQLLAAGAQVVASRTFPCQFHYVLVGPALHRTEIESHEVHDLIAAKILLPITTVTSETDRIEYREYNARAGDHIQREATQGYRYGFGMCRQCQRLPLAIKKDGLLYPHKDSLFRDALWCIGRSATCIIHRPQESLSDASEETHQAHLFG